MGSGGEGCGVGLGWVVLKFMGMEWGERFNVGGYGP